MLRIGRHAVGFNGIDTPCHDSVATRCQDNEVLANGFHASQVPNNIMPRRPVVATEYLEVQGTYDWVRTPLRSQL